LGWQPYRWDVTEALKKGANDLVIEVDALAQGGRGGFGGPPPAAGAPPVPTGGGGRPATSAAPPTSGLLGSVKLVAY